MNVKLILPFLLLLVNLVNGQDIKFLNDRQELVVSSTEETTYYLKIKSNNVLSKTTVKFSILENTNPESYNYSPDDETIDKNVSEFEVKFSVRRYVIEKNDSLLLRLSYLDQKGEEKESSVRLIFKKKVMLEKKESKIYDSLNTFRLLLGHNFDFFNDNKNSLISYGRLDFFKPDFFDKNTGLNIYVFQTKFNTSNNLNSLGAQDRALDIVKIPGQGLNDTIPAKYLRTDFNRTTKISNSAFGFGINYLSDSKLFNFIWGENTKVFFDFSIEYIRRQYTIDYNYEYIDSDTLTLNKKPESIYSASIKQRKFIYNELYLGYGFLVYHTTDVANVKFKYNLGMVFTPNGNFVSNEANYFLVPRKRGFAHWFNIELAEKVSKLNFVLGIDFRQNTSQGFIYNVYLSKSFTIKKIADFLTN